VNVKVLYQQLRCGYSSKL